MLRLLVRVNYRAIDSEAAAALAERRRKAALLSDGRKIYGT
jgi:hypothetical protein